MRKIKIDYPCDEEIERTKEIIKNFNIKNGEELTQLFLKSVVLLLSCVFEKFIKVSINDFDINPLYCVSLPGYTWQCGLKYTGINLQTLQDKDSISTLKNNLRGISSVMADRYVKWDENKKIIYLDATNFYGHSMSPVLPYDEMWHGHLELFMNRLEEILNTPDDSDPGYFVDVDLKNADNIKERTKNFPFAPGTKICNRNDCSDYMNIIKPDNYVQNEKLVCDWTDEKKFLNQYIMLKFYVRHGMVLEKFHDTISFKQIKWLEKYRSFITQKRNKAKTEFEKDFDNLLSNAFYGKTMENVRNRLRLELFRKDDTEKHY